MVSGWKKSKSQAQSALEYAIVIVCVVAALIAMQVYIKRGMQGKLRQVADDLGQQYAPRDTTGSTTMEYASVSQTSVRTLKLEDDVYATETVSFLGIPIYDENGNLVEIKGGSISTQKGSEHVGEMKSSLYGE